MSGFKGHCTPCGGFRKHKRGCPRALPLKVGDLALVTGELHPTFEILRGELVEVTLVRSDGDRYDVIVRHGSFRGAVFVARRSQLEPAPGLGPSGARGQKSARAEDVRNGSLSVTTLPDFGEFGSCKTGPRVVPVCRELRELVEGRLPPEGWLFPSVPPTGGGKQVFPFMSRGLLERGLLRLRRKLGMADDITWIVLRHTRASHWLQGGVSIYKVADWLGHTVKTCEEFYGSLADGYDPDCERMPAA